MRRRPAPRRPSSQFVPGGGGTVRCSHDGFQICGSTAWVRVYGVRELGLGTVSEYVSLSASAQARFVMLLCDGVGPNEGMWMYGP